MFAGSGPKKKQQLAPATVGVEGGWGDAGGQSGDPQVHIRLVSCCNTDGSRCSHVASGAPAARRSRAGPRQSSLGSPGRCRQRASDAPAKLCHGRHAPHGQYKCLVFQSRLSISWCQHVYSVCTLRKFISPHRYTCNVHSPTSGSVGMNSRSKQGQPDLREDARGKPTESRDLLVRQDAHGEPIGCAPARAPAGAPVSRSSPRPVLMNEVKAELLRFGAVRDTKGRRTSVTKQPSTVPHSVLLPVTGLESAGVTTSASATKAATEKTKVT